MGNQYADFEESSRTDPSHGILAMPKVRELYKRMVALYLDNEVEQWSEHMRDRDWLRIDLGISPDSVSCQRCGYMLDRSQAISFEVHQTVYRRYAKYFYPSRYSHYR